MKLLELMMFKISKISQDRLTWETLVIAKFENMVKNVLLKYISLIKLSTLYLDN